MLKPTYRSGDEVIYISDVHQVYRGEIATITEFDPEHRLIGLKFRDNEIIFVSWDEIKPVEVEEVGNIHLTFTVDEVLMMQQVVERMEVEGTYEWKRKLLESVREKLEMSYQKPVITKEQLEEKLQEDRSMLIDLNLQAAEPFVLAGKRSVYEFRFKIN